MLNNCARKITGIQLMDLKIDIDSTMAFVKVVVITLLCSPTDMYLSKLRTQVGTAFCMKTELAIF